MRWFAIDAPRQDVGSIRNTQHELSHKAERARLDLLDITQKLKQEPSLIHWACDYVPIPAACKDWVEAVKFSLEAMQRTLDAIANQ